MKKMEKISNKEFIKAVAVKTGYSQKNIKEVLDVAQEIIEDNLVDGNTVKVFSWLTIEPVEKAARAGRNPITGESIQIPAKTSVKAKFGKGIKDIINK